MTEELKPSSNGEIHIPALKDISTKVKTLLEQEHDLILEGLGILYRERQLKNGDFVSITDTGTMRKNEYLVMREAEKNGPRLEEYSWSKTEPEKVELDQDSLVRINELVDIVDYGEIEDA